SVFQIVQQVRALGAAVPDATVRTGVPAALVGGGGPPVELRITGSDFDTLSVLTNQILDIVKRTPGAIEARNTTIVPSPEYRAVVDREKAAQDGITAQTVASALTGAAGGVTASEL